MYPQQIPTAGGESRALRKRNQFSVREDLGGFTEEEEEEKEVEVILKKRV